MKTKPTPTAARARDRRQRALQIFQQMEWGNVELLDGWDGEELAELQPLLDEDDYERLLLALEAPAR